MLAEQRHSEILKLVNDQHSVSVLDIQLRLNVSRETVRRDLLALEQRHKLRRTHGGAVALESSEPELAVRLMTNAEAKRAIGRAVARMIPDGAAVLLGAGTTVQCVSAELVNRSSLTVITNCLASSLTLTGRNGNRVHMLGGEIQSRNQATFGREATEMLSKYFADFAVIGAGAVSLRGQLMDHTPEEAELLRIMLQSAQTIIVGADRTKFGRIAPVRVDGLDKASFIVTDAEPTQQMAEVLGRLPAQVVVAS